MGLGQEDELAINLNNNNNNGSNLMMTMMENYPDIGFGVDEGDGGNYSVNGSLDLSGAVTPTQQDDYVPYNLRPETYIIPVLFAIIFIIGVIGNGTLIVIFLKHRTMRNVPNM